MKKVLSVMLIFSFVLFQGLNIAQAEIPISCPDCNSPLHVGQNCGFNKCGKCENLGTKTTPIYSCNLRNPPNLCDEPNGVCTTAGGQEGICEASDEVGICTCEVNVVPIVPIVPTPTPSANCGCQCNPIMNMPIAGTTYLADCDRNPPSGNCYTWCVNYCPTQGSTRLSNNCF